MINSEKNPKVLILIIQCEQMGWANDLAQCVSSVFHNTEYNKDCSIKFISSRAYGSTFDQDFILKLAGSQSYKISFYEDLITSKEGYWQRNADLFNAAISHAIEEGCSFAIAADIRCRLLPYSINKFMSFTSYFKHHTFIGSYWRVPWFNFEEMNSFASHKTLSNIRSRINNEGGGINSYKGAVSDVSEMLPCQFTWGLGNQIKQGISFIPAPSPQSCITETVNKILKSGKHNTDKNLVESYAEMWAVPIYLYTVAPKKLQKKESKLLNFGDDSID